MINTNTFFFLDIVFLCHLSLFLFKFIIIIEHWSHIILRMMWLQCSIYQCSWGNLVFLMPPPPPPRQKPKKSQSFIPNFSLKESLKWRRRMLWSCSTVEGWPPRYSYQQKYGLKMVGDCNPKTSVREFGSNIYLGFLRNSFH